MASSRRPERSQSDQGSTQPGNASHATPEYNGAAGHDTQNDHPMPHKHDPRHDHATQPKHGQGSIRHAIGLAMPVGLGMVPLGLAFGILLTQMGFAWFWAPIFSFVIYAGSMEFLALSLVTGGVGPLSAALYGLLVNFRHVFYALNYPLHVIRSRLARAYGIYALTDETYAIVSANPNQRFTGRQVIAIQIVLQCAWVGGGILGALFGDAIPWKLEGMEFALTALFVVLLIESFLATRDVSLVLTAAVTAAVALLVSPGNMLMIAMLLYFAVLLARFYLPGLDRALQLRWRTGDERQEV